MLTTPAVQDDGLVSVVSATAEPGPSLPCRSPSGRRRAWVGPPQQGPVEIHVSRVDLADGRTTPAMSEVDARAKTVGGAFAWAIAFPDPRPSYRHAGPNNSSWLNGERGSTPATTAGETMAPSRSPPVSSLAPSSTARRMVPRSVRLHPR